MPRDFLALLAHDARPLAPYSDYVRLPHDSYYQILSLDITKLCNQPLLQIRYVESLRMYVVVYIIRKPEHQDPQVLDYKISKDRTIVISSAMAYLDKRNWNLGTMEAGLIGS